KATLEPPLRYLKQQESSNARHLIAQAIIDCAHKGIREPDEKWPCAYEDRIGSIGGKHDARGKHFCTVPGVHKRANRSFSGERRWPSATRPHCENTRGRQTASRIQ